ncbi:MAG: hypothetical protein V4576_02310 [Patescibacteria group bacterium]
MKDPRFNKPLLGPAFQKAADKPLDIDPTKIILSIRRPETAKAETAPVIPNRITPIPKERRMTTIHDRYKPTTAAFLGWFGSPFFFGLAYWASKKTHWIQWGALAGVGVIILGFALYFGWPPKKEKV